MKKAYRTLIERIGQIVEKAQVFCKFAKKRMRDMADTVMKGWQAFRIGIEGAISGIKLAFRLARSYYHGFKKTGE